MGRMARHRTLPGRNDSTGILLHEARKRCRRLLQGRRTHTMVGGRNIHLCHHAQCHHLHGLSRQSLCHGLDILPHAGDHPHRLLPRHTLLPPLLPTPERHDRLRIPGAALQRRHTADGKRTLHHLHGGTHGTRALPPLAGTHSGDRHRHLHLHRTHGCHHHRILYHGRRGGRGMGRRHTGLHPCRRSTLCRRMACCRHRRRYRRMSGHGSQRRKDEALRLEPFVQKRHFLGHHHRRNGKQPHQLHFRPDRDTALPHHARRR